MVSPGLDGRGISTVLDVALCLLLVSVAVATLALPAGGLSGHSDRPDAAATARALDTGTVAVTYELSTEAVATEAEGTVPSGEAERVAHGTHTELLAEAAVENATLDGRRLSNASAGFERRVGVAIENATDATGARTHVRAVWVPYPGAPTAGVATAGEAPPRGAAVAAATTTVPSGFPRVREQAHRAARRDGYAGVAGVLAAATVAGWFPPSEVRLALTGDCPVDVLLERRYRRTAATLGTSVDGPVGEGAPGRANARIEPLLAERFERDLRDRFDTPAAAADAVRVGEVRVVVRTW